jgi:hypothetical protein
MAMDVRVEEYRRLVRDVLEVSKGIGTRVWRIPLGWATSPSHARLAHVRVRTHSSGSSLSAAATHRSTASHLQPLSQQRQRAHATAVAVLDEVAELQGHIRSLQDAATAAAAASAASSSAARSLSPSRPLPATPAAADDTFSPNGAAAPHHRMLVDIGAGFRMHAQVDFTAAAAPAAAAGGSQSGGSGVSPSPGAAPRRAAGAAPPFDCPLDCPVFVNVGLGLHVEMGLAEAAAWADAKREAAQR